MATFREVPTKELESKKLNPHKLKELERTFGSSFTRNKKAKQVKKRLGLFDWFKNWTDADFANKGRWIGTIAVILSSAAYVAMKK